ncbi:MAG: hypothetical protein E7169_01580 [Firmicutes bacterium]|nr:hypothetical protein [Bacillota bacterium]
MEKIKLSDINFDALKKLNHQGTKSTLYDNGDTCIKIFNELYKEEKVALYKKFLEMEGIQINGVLLPIDVIVENDRLEGFTMSNFKNSVPLFDAFTTTRYVDCAEILKAMKKASLILRKIHKNGIICQDLSFDNILINQEGIINYCDIDSCTYNERMSPYLSILLKRFMVDYKKMKLCMVSKNLDRVSMLLSFYIVMYLKEIQKISKKEYHSLSDHIATLENARKYANMLLSSRNIPEVPYLDELISDFDEGIIDRQKQISIVRRIFRR